MNQFSPYNHYERDAAKITSNDRESKTTTITDFVSSMFQGDIVATEEEKLRHQQFPKISDMFK